MPRREAPVHLTVMGSTAGRGEDDLDVAAAIERALRLPLVSAISSGLLAPAGATADAHAAQLDRAQHGMDGLRNTLTDLLEVSRLGAGEPDTPSREVDLTALTDAALVRMPGQRRPDVVAHLPDTAPWHGNSRRASVIVDRLLANACHHTPQGTPIAVTLDHDGQGWQLTVADNGPGIPDAIRPEVFQPFVRGPDSGVGAPRLGLGLTIVSLFAAIHGGTARLDDVTEGTSLTVTFPDPPAVTSDEPGGAGEPTDGAS